jgi:hypothetical protein
VFHIALMLDHLGQPAFELLAQARFNLFLFGRRFIILRLDCDAPYGAASS